MGINLYEYVKNNSINLNDLLGLCPSPWTQLGWDNLAGFSLGMAGIDGMYAAILIFLTDIGFDFDGKYSLLAGFLQGIAISAILAGVGFEGAGLVFAGIALGIANIYFPSPLSQLGSELDGFLEPPKGGGGGGGGGC